MNKQKTYIAFLRGINVGGNTLIKMEELKKTFESIGYKNIKTILASGNIIFETQETNAITLTQTLEETLEKTFGVKILVILRTSTEIQSLINANPFKNTKVTPNTRLHVTFLSQNPQTHLTTPYEIPQKDFKIIKLFEHTLCSVVELSENGGTTELMKILEKEFGKKITTRTWNTITKIGNLLQ